jgi:hypothetical protein
MFVDSTKKYVTVKNGFAKRFNKFAAALHVVMVCIGQHCRTHWCAIFTGRFVLLL